MSADHARYFVDLADELALDTERFSGCVSATGDRSARIEADIAAAQEFGARGTPAIVVNGVYLAGIPRDTELETWQSYGN